MKKPVIITIIITAVVMQLLIGSILAFYAIPFVDANYWLIALNKNPSTISFPDRPQNLLHQVSPEYLNENYYSDIRSNKNISLEAWNEMSIHFNFHIKVRDDQSWEIVTEYDKKVTLTYIFYNGAWQCKQAELRNGDVIMTWDD